MSDEAYCYPPDFNVLRNRFGIRAQDELDVVERLFVTQRLRETIPEGHFDLAHMKAIHRHLFQDVYDWAGEIRTIEISKGNNQFQFSRFIEAGMTDIYRRLEVKNFLKGLSMESFASEAGHILGDLNYVHPFREGNGRTQVVFLIQLASQAGHRLDATKIGRNEWMRASHEAHLARYEAMARCIAIAIGIELGPD